MKPSLTNKRGIGKAWLRKAGFRIGLNNWNPNYYSRHACFMNGYRKGQMQRLLEGKTSNHAIDENKTNRVMFYTPNSF